MKMAHLDLRGERVKNKERKKERNKNGLNI
jgi:hypothetical protein